MIVAINYANEKYRKHQRINTKTARWFGKVDKVYSFLPTDISVDFYNQNKNILSYSRGNGLWLWKPYFIYKVMNTLKDGDIICYADSGTVYLKNIRGMVSQLKESGQDIMLFENSTIECQWTKKKVLTELDAYTDEIRFNNQIMATIVVIVVSDYTKKFISKWLELCGNEALIVPKEKDENEDYWYNAHREDQSILSVMSKKERIIPFSNPTDSGKLRIQDFVPEFLLCFKVKKKPYYLKHVYFLLPRSSNPYIYLLKYYLRRVLSMLGLSILRCRTF